MALPLLPLAMTGLSGLFGLINNKQKQQQTTTTTPTLDPAYGPLQQMLIRSATDRLSNPTGLPSNYESSGVANINRTYDLAGQGLENSLTSRGLGQSGVGAGALERLSSSRAGSIGQFRAGVPLAGRELQNQDLGMVAQLLGQGRGQTTSGTGMQGSGGGAAGGATNLMQMLGFLMGSGAFGGAPKPGAGG